MYPPCMCPRNRSTPPDPADPPATKSTSRRQTLGSDHDAPLRSAPGEGALDSRWLVREGQAWPAWWDAFKASRIALVDGEAEKTVGRIIHHIESRWESIGNLQHACEHQRQQRAPAGTRLSHFLAFLEDEIVLVFVRCADAVTSLWPAMLPGDAVAYAVVCELAGHLDRGLGVAALAAQANELSPAFRASVIEITDALVDWGAEMCTLTSALARMVVAEKPPRTA